MVNYMPGKARSKKPPAKHKTLKKKPDPNGNTRQRKWITKAIDWMKEGWSVRMIKDTIAAQKEGGLAQSTIEKIVFEANRIIIQDYSQDRASVVALHVKRYNRQIKRLLLVRDDDVINPKTGEIDEARGREKKVNAYFHCLESMFQKEKLLQFHNKSFKIVVNNIEEIEIQEAKRNEKKIDVSKLTFAERLELFALMNKAKLSENESMGVILHGRVAEKTIDIEHEVINETNLDKIKTTEIDKVNGRGISLADAASKLRQTMRQKAREEIIKVGGKIQPDEL